MYYIAKKRWKILSAGKLILRNIDMLARKEERVLQKLYAVTLLNKGMLIKLNLYY